MIDLYILLPMVSLALLFILFMTGAYKRSVTTVIYIISLVIALQCYQLGSPVSPGVVMISGGAIALVRAMLLHTNDRVVR